MSVYLGCFQEQRRQQAENSIVLTMDALMNILKKAQSLVYSFRVWYPLIYNIPCSELTLI